MHVLNIVTTQSSFFKAQVESLKMNGITVDTISVPGSAGKRSVVHYLKCYTNTLRSFSRKYDLVHANYGLTATIALLQPIRPVVLTLWGSDLMGSYSWLTKQTARYCDEVIVMSEEMKRELGQSAHVIPHGINLEQFSPIDQSDAQAAVGWNKDAKHVLFPYDPSREVKNHPLAKQVVDKVRDRVSTPVELKTIYGVDHDEMPMYINAADVLLLTSKREGSPNTIKESMACNLPVVATNVGDVQERLSADNVSSVCDTTEELVAALSELLRRGVRSNGRQHIQHLGLEPMGKRIKCVYISALKKQ